MSNDTLELLNEELDDMAIKMLRLMKDYIRVKLNLEELIKAGSLHLAKSRYIMGNRSVSVLQLPSEDSSEFLASTRVIKKCDTELEETLSFELSKLCLKDLKEADSGVKPRTNKNKGEPTTNENLDEDVAGKINLPDPLKWFGVLVPQNMRQAQSDFSKAIEYSIQCANIQLEIQRLRDKYKVKIREKRKLKT